MSGVITTGAFPKLLWPGINKIWGLTYVEWEKGAEWKRIFPVTKSTKNYEEDIGLTGLDLAPIKPEGEAIHYSTMKQAFVTKYQNMTYALGYIITQEEIEDNQYAQIAAQRTRNLAFVMHQTRENVAASVFNRGYDSFYAGGDGQPLFSTSHPIENGTFANTLQIAADLSEASLEQAAKDIENFVDNKGHKIALMPNILYIPSELRFDATRILKNDRWRPDTANRDINALYVNDTFPGGMVISHYLSDPDGWIIITNCQDGVKCMDRVPTELADDNDFDTTNMKYRARARYSYRWTDPRGAYGSPGA